jgi:hypothetical protein
VHGKIGYPYANESTTMNSKFIEHLNARTETTGRKHKDTAYGLEWIRIFFEKNSRI